VNQTQQFDLDYERHNIVAAKQGVKDTLRLMSDVDKSVRGDATAMKRSMHSANKKILAVLAQIGRAIASASEASGFGSDSLGELSEAMGLSTSGAMNTLAASLNTDYDNIAVFDDTMHDGAVGVVSRGSDALSRALLSAGETATAAADAASKKTSALVDGLTQTKQAYGSALGSASDTRKISQKALKALVSGFALSMDGFKSSAATVGADAAAEQAQLIEIVDGLGEAVQDAANSSALGMSDLKAYLSDVQTSIQSKLATTTDAVAGTIKQDIKTSTTLLKDASAAYAKFDPQQKVLLTQYGTILDSAGKHIAVLQKAIGEARTVEAEKLAEVKDTKILNRYSNWLTSFKAAVNDDVSSIQGSLT